ncbi:Metal-dependent hydrolase YbeY, involved in rRNA and/or ribosome maturation and assembly [hydrothermal vent metagenome]|uniref:Metal-dependent hydrolase YbeY, involved in rRNA and/or ribosome maturation and assembly n=1 Tax=hydrothermal vent metagenome TaxID=652676 RepID=A0A3B0WTU8_9ZZZZ
MNNVTVEINISENFSSSVDSNNLESADDVPPGVPEKTLLQSWASAAYLDSIPAVVSIQITTPDEMQQLNKQYRNKDKPTNVLSFPMQLPEEVDMCLLGDIVLCASVINNEADQQEGKNDAHWVHMVVHGMLHLQGFDHIEEQAAEKMEQLEIKILGELGIANPYQ